MELFRQMTVFGGFLNPEAFFKSINYSSSAGNYETIESLWALEKVTGCRRELGFIKEGTEIVDLPACTCGGKTEHYSESQRETTED